MPYPQIIASKLGPKKTDPDLEKKNSDIEKTSNTSMVKEHLKEESMASDFAWEASRNEDKARDELMKENIKVNNIRSNIAKKAKETYEFNLKNKPFYAKKDGERVKDQKLQAGIRALTYPNEVELKDSLLKSEDSKLLNTKYSRFGAPGMSCNAFSCNLQQQGGATVPKDFSYRRAVDGKMIHLKKGDPIPTVFSNQQMDKLAPQFGYEHVQLKDANQVHETGVNQDYAPGTNSAYTVFQENKNLKKGGAEQYIKNIKEVDEILPGDIYRGGFNPSFNDSGEMNSGVVHSMTTGGKNKEGKRIFYSNPGNLMSGLKKTTTTKAPSATYLRYIGNTKSLQQKLKGTSSIANTTRSNRVKTNPISLPLSGKIKAPLLKKR